MAIAKNMNPKRHKIMYTETLLKLVTPAGIFIGISYALWRASSTTPEGKAVKYSQDRSNFSKEHLALRDDLDKRKRKEWWDNL